MKISAHDYGQAISITVLNNGVIPINHALIDRVKILIDSDTFDSDTSPGDFDLSNTGHIEFMSYNLSPGEHEMAIITYDEFNNHGILWPDKAIRVY
jgi:hypothetical protein